MSEEKKQPLQHIHLAVKEEAICPSCGKYVGAYERCPFCQASMGMRMSLRVVRRISVIGSIVGLIILYFASRMHEVPKVHIGEIQITNNMALVRLEGTIDTVKEDTAKNNLKMTLDDGTGQMSLNAFGKLDEFHKTLKDNFPQEGDQIEVSGNLNISEKFGKGMFLSSARRYKLIKRETAQDIKIGSITDAIVSKRVWIEAQIVDTQHFKLGYYLTLKDATGELKCTLFDRELEAITVEATKDALLKPGTLIRALVSVDKYQDELQLRFAGMEPEKLQIKGFQEVTGERKQSAQTDTSDEDKVIMLSDVVFHKKESVVTIDSVVKAVKNIHGVGYSITLADDTGEEILFIYDNVLSRIKDSEKLDKAKKNTLKIRAKVKVSEYRGKRQLLPVEPELVQITEVTK